MKIEWMEVKSEDEEGNRLKLIKIESYDWHIIRKASFGYDSRNSIENISNDGEKVKFQLEIFGVMNRKTALKIKETMERNHDLEISYKVSVGDKEKFYTFKGGNLKYYKEQISSSKNERYFSFGFSFEKGRKEVLSVGVRDK